MASFLFSKRWSLIAVLGIGASAGFLGFMMRASFPPEAVPPPKELLSADKIAPVRAVPKVEAVNPATGEANERTSEDWLALKSRARSQQSGSEMAIVLEKMAAKDPGGALKLALAEENWKIREQLRDAVLRAWSTTAPEAAAYWALHQSSTDDRLSAMYAVFEGTAMHDPKAAVLLAQKLYAETPTLAADYGTIAITMLAKRGAFEAAIDFATQANGHAAQGGWVNTAFLSCAQYQPELAASALPRLANTELRHEAFLGVVAGWVSANPAGLASWAKSMDQGEDRKEAMQTALVRWVGVDPVGASAWINAMDPGPDLDQAAAAVASVPSLAYNHPEIALSWATSIRDADTRANTLRGLAAQLSVTDISMARRLLTSNVWSNPVDRSAFSEGVHAPPPF